jgi:hypothetical protein
MFQEPKIEETQRYFANEHEIMVLTKFMSLFLSMPERYPLRSQIVQQCSTELSWQNPQWTPRRVRIYFNNHKNDILQFSPSSIDAQQKSKSLDNQNIPQISINLPVPDPSAQIEDLLQIEPDIHITNLVLEAKTSSRFPFIRVATLDRPISMLYSDQNCNNELPQNATGNLTYLDELLSNFNYEEPNLLVQIPKRLENLNNDHTALILKHLGNGSLSQRQLLRHFGINHFILKKFLRNNGFQSSKFSKGRLETFISGDLEQLVIQYRKKFVKGYQTICKALKLKGLPVTETQIRSIFDKCQLWKYKKVTEKKKIHNQRYVAFYCNMEWHIDLHTWNHITPNNEVVPQYLFAVIDDLTRYLLFAKVLENKSMESTGTALIECINTTNCKPYIIATDNGKEFTGSFFTQVLREHHIKHYTTHPYTPEENAKLERWWGTLEGAVINQQDLEMLVKEYNFNWPHKELQRMTGKKMTPADAWRSFKRYEGIPEEQLIFLLG